MVSHPGLLQDTLRTLSIRNRIDARTAACDLDAHRLKNVFWSLYQQLHFDLHLDIQFLYSVEANIHFSIVSASNLLKHFRCWCLFALMVWWCERCGVVGECVGGAGGVV
jgi:hypothetical protein